MSQLPVFSNDGGLTLQYPQADGLTSQRLALGCMFFGGSWAADEPITDDERTRAREALETALDLGWDFFDHADIYCSGKSETIFGELIRELGVSRESIIVQDKCGIRFEDEPIAGDPHRYDFSREHIIASANSSLKRLGIEYLDSFLLHRPDVLAEPDEVVAAFAELKESGKVRHFGVSNFTPPMLALYQQAGFTPIVNQVELNLLQVSLLDSTMVTKNRDPESGHTADGTIEWNRSHGVVTQAWAPMAYGYLCGRRPDKETEQINRTAAKVHQIAQRHEVPAEAVVIGWLLRHPAVIQPVIGTRSPSRLRACHQALELRLTREEWYALYLSSRGCPLS